MLRLREFVRDYWAGMAVPDPRFEHVVELRLQTSLKTEALVFRGCEPIFVPSERERLLAVVTPGDEAG